MVRLLILADDFTGGLDTGVQCAAKGISTLVLTRPDTGLSIDAFDCRVLVLVTRTRHARPEAAWDTVKRLAEWAREQGIPYIYKKTDSALRGNVGAELAAALRGCGANVLPFLPALPSHRRVTRGGVHYIDGVPVAESSFGRDPFTPVRESDVARLLDAQTDLPVSNGTPAAFPDADGIWVIDAQTDEDLRQAGHGLAKRDLLRVSAGCAGFAACLPELLGLEAGQSPRLPDMSGGLFMLCGSVNPITRRQLDWAERHGFMRLHLRPAQKLERDWFDTAEGQAALERLRDEPARWLIVDANDPGGDNRESAGYIDRRGWTMEEARERVCDALGRVLVSALAGSTGRMPLVTGGDTLLRCMDMMGVHRLEPLAELFPGVVLSRFEYGSETRHIISKSGGFGGETLLTDLKRMMEYPAREDLE